MTRMSFTSLWARRRRLAGTAVAVVLGVSFLSGTLVLGDTLSANFDSLFAEVSAGTDVVVRSDSSVSSEEGVDEERGLIDQSMADTVRDIDGVADAEAQIVGFGQLIGEDGDAVGGNGPPRLAGSWIDNPDLNPYQLAEGRAPEAADEVVVNRGAADDGGLEVGDTTVVQTPAPIDVTIVGISTFGETDGLGDTTWTAFTLEAAQEHVTGRPGQVSEILVQADEGVSSEELRDRVQGELDGDVEVITGDDLAGERSDAISEEFLTMVRTFLVAFAGIALVVGALSINNSFRVTVTQRTRELALLRAVGASRRQVRRMVTFEALLLGVGAAVAGAAIGLVVAALLKGLFDAFGFALPAGGMEIRPMSLIISVAAGVVATMVAAQSAARRASKVAPLAALRDTSAEPSGLLRRRLVAGAAVLVAGVGLGLAGASAGTFLLTGGAALLLVVGTLMLAPVGLRPTARVVGAGLRRLRGVNGMLAEQNALRNPRRSAATGTALVVGVAVVTLFTVFAASIKATLEEDLAADFGADLAVSTPPFGGGLLDPALAGELEALPELDQAVGLGDAQAEVNGDTTTLTSGDRSKLESVAQVGVADGSLDTLGPGDLAVGESKAEDEGWSLGTPVDVSFSDGRTEQVTVGAIYEDHEIVGSMVVDPELVAEHTPQPTNRIVLLTLADGFDLDQARQAVTPLAERGGGDVQDQDEFSGEQVQGLDLLLGVVYALLALAIIIALLGIANTLSLAVYERRHEIGLMRAVGQTRRQVRSVMRLESVIVAAFGTLTGLVLGGFLGWVLFATVTAEDGGTFDLAIARLAIVAVVGALAGVLAARRPARRAAKLPVLEAIAAE